MILLTPLMTFQIVGSMKLHFNNIGYDFRKYKLNQGIFTEERFSSQRGRQFYKDVCNQYQFMDRLIYLCASNYFYNPKATIVELYDHGRSQYLEFRKRIDSVLYHFEQDISSFMNKNKDFNSLKDILYYKPERIYDSIIGGSFHPYSTCILNRFIPFIDNIRKNSDTLYMEMVYGPVQHRLNKFNSFVSIRDVGELDALKELVKKF